MVSVEDDMFGTETDPPHQKQSSLFADLAPPSSSYSTIQTHQSKKRLAESCSGQENECTKVRKAGPAVRSSAAGDKVGPAKDVSLAISAAYSEDKGSRKEMEDIAVINLDAGKELVTGHRLSFFGVFDGHGGRQVAHHVAENIHSAVMAAGLEAEVAAGGAQPNIKACRAAIAAGFRALDEAVLKWCAAEGWADGATAVAVWMVGETVLVGNVGDAKCVLARRPQAPGCTTDTGNQVLSTAAATPAQRGGQSVAAAKSEGASAGGAAGSRTKGEGPAAGGAESVHEAQPGVPQAGHGIAVERGITEPAVASPSGDTNTPQVAGAVQGCGTAGPSGGADAKPEQYKAITLTREHKAIFPQERQRIERVGGSVSADGRLAGRIEVSRAFGDRAFKKLGMTATPDIQAFRKGPRDAFMLCGCDGFWGVFGAQDAVDFAAREMAKGYDVKQTCNRLIYEAIRERHCKDNCTVMMIKLGG